MKRTFLVSIASFMVVCLSTAAFGMDMGTNFWNIGWGSGGTTVWNDCFKDGTNFATTTNPWKDQFLQDIKVYRCLRFMDWTNVNNNNNLAEWNNRVSESADQRGGVAFEWQIDLCNRNNSDMWVCTPTNPSDDYLRQLATLIKNTLNPNLKCYIEYSNETWNWAFTQAAFCRDKGVALGLQGDQYEAANRYHVVAALRVFRMFEEVYGGPSPRIVKVIGGQTGQSWLCGVHLSVLGDSRLNPDGIKADAYAVAPYIGHQVQGNASDACEQLKALIAPTVAADKVVRDMVKAKGMRFVAYEGGQHIADYSTPQGNGSNIASGDPRMYDVYIQLFDAYKDVVDLFDHYCHSGVWGGQGSWGAMQRTGDPLSSVPKWRAILDWVKNNSVPDNSPATITSEPANVSATTGSVAQFSVTASGSSLITYQWRKNGTAIPGGFNAALSLPNVQPLDNGAKISVVVSNAYGADTSRDAILTVTAYNGFSISRTAAAPTIDGVEDATWRSATAQPIAHSILGSPANPADLSGQFKTLWDADNLYVLITVTDSVSSTGAAVSYHNDGVEVYVDGDNSKGTIYDDNDIQYRLVRGKTTIESSGSGKATNVVFAQSENSSEYTAEFRFPWTTIGSTAAAFTLIGLEVHITDNDGTAERKTILAWAGTTDNAWNTPSAFGTAQLADAPTASSRFGRDSAPAFTRLTGGFLDSFLRSGANWDAGILSAGLYSPDGRCLWQFVQGSNVDRIPSLGRGAYVVRVVRAGGGVRSMALVRDR